MQSTVLMTLHTLQSKLNRDVVRIHLLKYFEDLYTPDNLLGYLIRDPLVNQVSSPFIYYRCILCHCDGGYVLNAYVKNKFICYKCTNQVLNNILYTGIKCYPHVRITGYSQGIWQFLICSIRQSGLAKGTWYLQIEGNHYGLKITGFKCVGLYKITNTTALRTWPQHSKFCNNFLCSICSNNVNAWYQGINDLALKMDINSLISLQDLSNEMYAQEELKSAICGCGYLVVINNDNNLWSIHNC